MNLPEKSLKTVTVQQSDQMQQAAWKPPCCSAVLDQCQCDSWQANVHAEGGKSSVVPGMSQSRACPASVFECWSPFGTARARWMSRVNSVKWPD